MSELIDQAGGILGLTGDAISLFGAVKDALFPPAPSAEISTFRVHVGQVAALEDEGITGGTAPALAGWDTIGVFLGQDTPDGINTPFIEAGGARDYQIIGPQEIDYLSVVQNGNDAICIYLLTGVSGNHGRTFAWNGDLGKACGAAWFPQQNAVADIEEGTKRFVPACVWIDGNDDEDFNFKGFNLHLGSFNGRASAEVNRKLAQSWQENRDLLCKSEPRFSMYEDIEIGMQNAIFKVNPSNFDIGTVERRDAVLNGDNWRLGALPEPGELPQRQSGRALLPSFICTKDECPPSGGSFEMDLGVQREPSRRVRRKGNNYRDLDRRERLVATMKRRQLVHADRLIVSNLEQHSAIEICNSVTSLGPDFVSIPENMFCDMSEKKLWPVCGESADSYCFDIESQTVRGLAPLPAAPGQSGFATNLTSMQNVATTVKNNYNDEVLVPIIPVKSYNSVSTWDAV